MNTDRTSEQGINDRRVNARKVSEFLALAFGLSWTSALVLYFAGIEIGTLRGLILTTVLFMWAPAVAAIVVQLYHGESIRKTIGIRIGRPGWILLAWLAPTAFIAATIAVGTLFPGVTFTTGYEAYLLELGLTQERANAAVAELESFPGPPALLLVADAQRARRPGRGTRLAGTAARRTVVTRILEGVGHHGCRLGHLARTGHPPRS